MSEVIELKYRDDVNMFVQCENGVAQELQEFFSYKADGYRFHPKYKAKMWDGNIYVFSAYKRTLYVGLIYHIKKFAEIRGYQVIVDSKLEQKIDITPKDVVEYVKTLKLSAHDTPITPRDYQYFAIYHSIRNKRATVIAPTSAGKSLNIYCTVRWYTEHYNKKVLIIVPTVTLVTQLNADFDDYSSLVDWKAEDEVHCISAGIEKDTDKQIIISTWQSLQKQPKSYFDQFGMAYVDEVHGAKAVALKNIMEKMTTCEYKLGTTGTTGSKKVSEVLIQGLFGRIKKTVTTKELMDRNEVAKLKIMCVALQYPEIERKDCRNLNYQEEVNFLTTHTRRNNLIVDSIGDMKGNVLILVTKVNHIKILHELATKKYPDKNVYIIHGKTSKEDRERIRLAVDKDDNSLLFATYGTFSTGVSVRNINHVVFASTSKSEIRVLQSLGRGLRLSETKDSVLLWDIFDDLSIKKHKNYTLKHFIERFKIYTKEKFTMENLKISV